MVDKFEPRGGWRYPWARQQPVTQTRDYRQFYIEVGEFVFHYNRLYEVTGVNSHSYDLRDVLDGSLIASSKDTVRKADPRDIVRWRNATS